MADVADFVMEYINSDVSLKLLIIRLPLTVQ